MWLFFVVFIQLCVCVYMFIFVKLNFPVVVAAVVEIVESFDRWIEIVDDYIRRENS